MDSQPLSTCPCLRINEVSAATSADVRCCQLDIFNTHMAQSPAKWLGDVHLFGRRPNEHLTPVPSGSNLWGNPHSDGPEGQGLSVVGIPALFSRPYPCRQNTTRTCSHPLGRVGRPSLGRGSAFKSGGDSQFLGSVNRIRSKHRMAQQRRLIVEQQSSSPR